ncbi:MAG: hypothetical protein R8P61_16720 [Bacteroidia bacterium]|nr:hypothetical protein [Bacteroidia bacterium]
MIQQSYFNERLFKTQEALLETINTYHVLQNCSILEMDLKSIDIQWNSVFLRNVIFLGCELAESDQAIIRSKGGLIIPPNEGLPYNPYRRELYTCRELLDGYNELDDQSLDLKIYEHFSVSRYNPHIIEALSQRIHDHAIDDSLRELVGYDDTGMTRLRCVGFMGGHGKLRTDPFYRKTAHTARLLGKEGYFIISGGGPGIMEAANLGAYFASYEAEDLEKAFKIMEVAPHYTDAGFIQSALDVFEYYPEGAENLAIPTWFYGHEPSNVFASHIAKYFSNSIREDTLLALCHHGVVFAPGSAGTTQEIFQDAAQNHYATFGYYSPMVFLGKERYEIETSLFPVLKQLAYNQPYYKFLYLSDEPEEVVDFILNNPPEQKVGK